MNGTEIVLSPPSSITPPPSIDDLVDVHLKFPCVNTEQTNFKEVSKALTDSRLWNAVGWFASMGKVKPLRGHTYRMMYKDKFVVRCEATMTHPEYKRSVYINNEPVMHVHSADVRVTIWRPGPWIDFVLYHGLKAEYEYEMQQLYEKELDRIEKQTHFKPVRI